MIFDTHGHYDDHQFDEDRHELLCSMAAHGVGTIVNIGADMDSSKASLVLKRNYDFVYATLGVHPSEVEDLTERDMEWLASHAKEEKVVAIGEIGLDYHWPDPHPAIQKRWFVRQIELAQEVGLPIVVHSRDAAADTMDIITKTKAYECGGVIHCFSYSPEIAKKYVDMGFYIGIGGVVTFKNAKKCVRTVEQIPLENMVIETDCPYMAPEPHRGKRNDSTNLHYVVNRIAELKGVTPEQVMEVTAENARKMYRIQ